MDARPLASAAVSRRARLHGRWVVRLPTWLGDTVMAVPTIRALDRAVDELVLWGPATNATLLRATGVRAATLAYRRRPGLRGLGDAARSLSRLAAANLSGALILPNAFEPALLTSLARVRRRVGYDTELRGRFLTDAVPPPDPLSDTHDADRYAALLATLQLEPPHMGDNLLATPGARARTVRELLASPRPLLGLVPGSANGPARRWPAESYALLAAQAVERWQALPVLLGGASDRAVAGQIESLAGTRCANLTGTTDIVDLAAVLGRCRAVVSNDNGAAHLAAALSCPTLVLFGPTDPKRTRPRGPAVRVSSVAAFCQPCQLKDCPIDHRCMTGLTPEMALTALESLWRSIAPGGR